jgi:hypothetical protein
MFAPSRSSGVVVGCQNISRKSGVAMATSRSIVDQVTVRLECQETGDDFDPSKDRRPIAAVRVKRGWLAAEV